MLVLTRKVQESVVVGGTVGFERVLKVTVLEVIGGKVRLGFEADADVPVNRAEVLERILADGPRPPPPQGPAALAATNAESLPTAQRRAQAAFMAEARRLSQEEQQRAKSRRAGDGSG